MIIDTEFNSAAQVPGKVCVDAAVLAEQQGFQCVWKGESNSRDPMVLLSAMAARTEKVDFGTAIYHLYGRSPTTLALQAATFNEYADGRLILGLGVGNPTIAGWHGQVHEKPLRQMREYVEILRAVYSGERVPDYEGDYFSISKGFKMAFDSPPHPLRVWIAGLGPQMSKLAGKLGDGIMLNMANPPMIKEIVENFKEGARSAGKSGEGLDVVAKVRVALHEDKAQAYWTLKKVATFYSIQRGYSDMLATMGWGEQVAKIQEAYRTEGFGAARKQIPDEMIDDIPMYAATDLSGLQKKLDGFAEAGATRCVVAYVPTGDDTWGELQHYLKNAEFARAGQAKA